METLSILVLQNFLSLSPWIVGPLALCVFVYLTHIVHRWLNTGPMPSHTLYLRTLKKSGASMLTGNETGNIFLEEMNLLTDLVVPKVDFCVMKVVGGDLPILVQQERLHAKMHNEGKSERRRLNQGMAHWSWLVGIADFFLLRAGREVGLSCAGFVEATAGVWIYLQMVLPFTRGFMSNEFVYHALEEFEHGALTTQYLRKQVGILTPLFTFPVLLVFFFLYFLTPPIVVLLTNPAILKKPRTYADFVLYYCTYIPVFIVTIYSCIVYWVLPFSHDEQQLQERYQYFLRLVQERGIHFEIVDQATYTVG